MEVSYYNKNFRIKTERAIQLINIYQNCHSEVGKLSLLLGSPRLPHPQQKQKKNIEPGKWLKMQLMQSELKFVSITHDHGRDTGRSMLKLIFREFSGREVSFGIASKPQPLPLEQCSHKVKAQKIFKIQLSPTRQTFITFHSPELSFFKFKYELFSEENQQSLPERAASEQRKTLYNLPKIQNRSLYFQPKSQRSQASLELKPRLKSPRMETLQDAVRERLKSISRQKLRLLQAKQKKNGIIIYQEKSRQLREISKRCTGLLEQYQQFCREHSKKKEKALRSSVMLILLTKFAAQTVRQFNDKTQKLSCAAHLRSALKAAAAKFMKINQNLKQISPNPNIRQLSTVTTLVGMEGKSIYAHSCKKAAEMLMDCFGRVAVGAKVNKLLEKSTQYRVKIRTIQKYWQERNKAQIASFQQYVNHQIKDLLSKHAQFRPFYDLFYQKKVGRELSWQYLRESSQKLKSIYGSYSARLAQIEQMRQANAHIALFNGRALKKHQKQYLQIPSVPPYPATRYFRDISHLKSMTRTWFQLQWRRHNNSNQKGKQEKRAQSK